ncbi:collagen alpha-1(I) chain-like [Panthera uncia]|uniref:collagen alpha-1(I) chain-like n=1 Tax=Panthera uncia TaxID=29064 RepID=UPI0020FF9209|nr:collagen alpha-1(I) chain-like [Panthera uncia]
MGTPPAGLSFPVSPLKAADPLFLPGSGPLLSQSPASGPPGQCGHIQDGGPEAFCPLRPAAQPPPPTSGPDPPQHQAPAPGPGPLQPPPPAPAPAPSRPGCPMNSKPDLSFLPLHTRRPKEGLQHKLWLPSTLGPAAPRPPIPGLVALSPAEGLFWPLAPRTRCKGLAEDTQRGARGHGGEGGGAQTPGPPGRHRAGLTRHSPASSTKDTHTPHRTGKGFSKDGHLKRPLTRSAQKGAHAQPGRSPGGAGAGTLGCTIGYLTGSCHLLTPEPAQGPQLQPTPPPAVSPARGLRFPAPPPTIQLDVALPQAPDVGTRQKAHCGRQRVNQHAKEGIRGRGAGRPGVVLGTRKGFTENWEQEGPVGPKAARRSGQGSSRPEGSLWGESRLCQAAVEPGFKLRSEDIQTISPHGPLRPLKASAGEDGRVSFLSPHQETEARSGESGSQAPPATRPAEAATCSSHRPTRVGVPVRARPGPALHRPPTKAQGRRPSCPSRAHGVHSPAGPAGALLGLKRGIHLSGAQFPARPRRRSCRGDSVSGALHTLRLDFQALLPRSWKTRPTETLSSPTRLLMGGEGGTPPGEGRSSPPSHGHTGPRPASPVQRGPGLGGAGGGSRGRCWGGGRFRCPREPAAAGRCAADTPRYHCPQSKEQVGRGPSGQLLVGYWAVALSLHLFVFKGGSREDPPSADAHSVPGPARDARLLAESSPQLHTALWPRAPPGAFLEMVAESHRTQTAANSHADTGAPAGIRPGESRGEEELTKGSGGPKPGTIAVPAGSAFLSTQRPLGPAHLSPDGGPRPWPCWGQPLLTLPPRAWMVRPQPAASDPRSGPTRGRPGGQSAACPTPEQVPPSLMKLPHTRAVSHGGSDTCRGVGTHTGERKRAQRGHIRTRGWCRATGHHPATSRGGSGKEQLLPARSAPTPDNRRVCSEYGAGPAPRGSRGSRAAPRQGAVKAGPQGKASSKVAERKPACRVQPAAALSPGNDVTAPLPCLAPRPLAGLGTPGSSRTFCRPLTVAADSLTGLSAGLRLIEAGSSPGKDTPAGLDSLPLQPRRGKELTRGPGRGWGTRVASQKRHAASCGDRREGEDPRVAGAWGPLLSEAAPPPHPDLIQTSTFGTLSPDRQGPWMCAEPSPSLANVTRPNRDQNDPTNACQHAPRPRHSLCVASTEDSQAPPARPL